jgi:hypothetical protein
MVVTDSWLRAYIAENSQLLLVLFTHVFFLLALVVEQENVLLQGAFSCDYLTVLCAFF